MYRNQRALSTGSENSADDSPRTTQDSSKNTRKGSGAFSSGIPRSSKSNKRKTRGGNSNNNSVRSIDLTTQSDEMIEEGENESQDNTPGGRNNRIIQSDYSHTASSSRNQESDGEQEEENDGGGTIRVTYSQLYIPSLEMGSSQERQYELMVEPASPRSSLLQNAEIVHSHTLPLDLLDYANISATNYNSTAVGARTGESYEETGGDHYHDGNLTIPNTMMVQEQPASSTQYHSQMNYHHNRISDEKIDSYYNNGNLTNSSNSGAQPQVIFSVNSVAPRPIRNHPVAFTTRTVDSSPTIIAAERRPNAVREVINSISPSNFERGRRSEGNNSTPDRDEVAQEAAKLRQGLNNTKRFSPT
jgi:hypothetical protein